ncbi:MAG: MEDS domain-containing protein [Roseiarcus sp.]|jgi:excisionase family DNA binding protein
MGDYEGMLSLEDAARYLSVSKTSLRRWTKDGQLHCHRIGARAERRFDKKMLDEFLLRRSAGPALAGLGTPLVDAMWQAAQEGRPKHVCLYFRNPIEQWEAFRQYFLDHYRAGLPTTYLHHASSRDQLIERVRDEGIDAQDAINRGLLRIVSARDSYLRQGVFSADFMISFMRLVMVRLAADGFRKHLVTGEMDWFFSGTPGVEEIHTYERRLNKLFDEYPDVTIVCQYDITKFDGEGVLQACASHPIVHLDEQLRQGFFTPAKSSLLVE